jgi:hypothetical protein
MYSVDRRLESREELLWECTTVYGVETCSFEKPATPTIIDWETEEKFRIQKRYTGPNISWRGCVNVYSRVTYSTYNAPGP